MLSEVINISLVYTRRDQTRLFVLSQDVPLEDLFVGGGRPELRLVQSGDDQGQLYVLHLLYAHLEGEDISNALADF